MRKVKFSIIDIDKTSNVAFADNGAILEIESYVDNEDTPCLPEEAYAVYVITGTTSFQKFILNKEDE